MVGARAGAAAGRPTRDRSLSRPRPGAAALPRRNLPAAAGRAHALSGELGRVLGGAAAAVWQQRQVRADRLPGGLHAPQQIPNETRGTLLLPWKFDDEDKMLRIRGRLFREELPRGEDAPVPCHLYAAGFNFCRAEPVLRDCPYDGSLHHLFFGEEISMAVRLFTWGYDLFAPAQSVVYHCWSREHRPPPLLQQLDDNHQQERIAQLRQKSMAKVREQVLGRGEGLGTVRSVSDFAASIGVDFESFRVQEAEPPHFDGIPLADPVGIGIDTFDKNTKSLIQAFLG